MKRRVHNEAIITYTYDAAGNRVTDTHTIRVDTEVTNFTQSSDNVLNATEAAAGLEVTGTVEPGSTLVLRFGSGASHTVTVGRDCSWSFTIPAGEIPPGQNNVVLTATATDAVGNSSTLTRTVYVDTEVRNFGHNAIAGDNVMNAAEHAAGVTISGTVEANSLVVVRLENGSTRSFRAGADGKWSVKFEARDLPTGEGEMDVTITATDPVGNVATRTQTVVVDTIAPESPEVISFTTAKNSSGDVVGLRGITTELTEDAYTFHRIDGNGAVSTVNATQSDDAVFDETSFRFATSVPDGSYLVINNADDAGNSASTLLIVDNTNSVNVDLDRAGLSRFDFAAIDLTFAPDAQLHITEEQLKALTGPDQQLIIKGDSGDIVAMEGATATGETETIGGQRYTVYTLGDDGASILLDEDISATLM